MTDETKTPEDDPAAEYVLGVLDVAARAEAQERIERDLDFAAQVTAWEERLSALNDAYDPVQPPERLKSSIDAYLFPSQTQGGNWLRWLTAGAIAAAIALTALIWTNQQGRDVLVAELTSDTTAFALSALVEGEEITVALRSGDVPDDRDLHIWLIVGEAAPVSLGLFGEPLTLPETPFGAGAAIAVSLESTGGSTTGAPTGPIVALGELQKM